MIKDTLIALIIISFFTNFYSCSTTKIEQNFTIGKIINNRAKFKASKKSLINFFNKNIALESDENYENVEIVSENINSETLYFLKLTSSSKKMTTYRWLQEKGKNLILKDSKDFKYQFLRITLTCKGGDDCYPRLLMNDKNQYFLSCLEEGVCIVPDKNAPTCEMSKSIFW